MMKQVILRNIPEEIHKEIKVAAVRADVSMQDLVLEILANARARGEALEKLASDRSR